jgi:hypothetical protein
MRWTIFFALFLLTAASLWQRFIPASDLRVRTSYSYNEGYMSLNPETVDLVSLGYQRLLSSTLWLRFLQNTPPKKIEPGMSSWIFHDLLSISVLDPEFYPIYTDAAIFLSVITEDKQGAEEIFLRGTKQFPEDWRIRSYLGYHYEWELKDSKKAFVQYRLAATAKDAPDLVRLIAASYTIKDGLKNGVSKKAAVQLVKNYMQQVKNPAMLKRLQDKLQKIESEK